MSDVLKYGTYESVAIPTARRLLNALYHRCSVFLLLGGECVLCATCSTQYIIECYSIDAFTPEESNVHDAANR